MRKHMFLALLIMIIITPGCVARQPFPIGPEIGGRLSGLPNGMTATIHIRSLTNGQSNIWTDQKNGDWKVAVPAGYNHFLIIPEASNFKSSPENYTILIQDQKAYIEIDGNRSSTEATHLDFLFISN